MDRIDGHISNVRGFLSDASMAHDDFSPFIVKHLGIESSNEYNSIIDCYYLFEDTQLAKRSFMHSPKTAVFGDAYLRMYGVMNACYLQQQALYVCGKSLSVVVPRKQVEACEVFDYRNCFGAHTPNKGPSGQQHSYIVDRFSLLGGRLAGYSANSTAGHVAKDADIISLIDAWNEVLAVQLALLEARIVSGKT